MAYAEKMTLEKIHVDGPEIVFHYSVDAHLFSTKLYYDHVHFDVLKLAYGAAFIEKLLFHIAFFEGMKHCSLFPRFYDIVPYSKYVNQDLLDLFSLLYKNISAQQRWEHNIPDYNGPQILFESSQPDQHTATIRPGPIEILFSCGGGKDSLVSMKLLERADLPYSVSQYSHSVYGRHDKQHELIGQVVSSCNPKQRHRFYILEDFLASPVLSYHYKDTITSFCAPEYCVFNTLPLMLSKGYTTLCVGHERDADVGSFFWEKAQQEVNHQWGKSLEAEIAFTAYIQKHLLRNMTFFSILKPLYDFLIFQLLRKDQQLIHLTHSCNIEKPWCKRCPKCIYVWLCCSAYLDTENIFGDNLFDLSEVEETLLSILGMHAYKPFECIGEIDDARLACYICIMKGWTGHVIDLFKEQILPTLNAPELLRKYNTLSQTQHAIPSHLLDRIWPELQSAQVNESDFLLSGYRTPVQAKHVR